MKKNVLTLIVCSFVLQACDDFVSQHLSFDDVTYVSDFPKRVELDEGNLIDLDLMGCVDFFGNDSVLVFKMMGLEKHWKVCSIFDLSEGMELLKKGNGPDEFVNMPGDEYFRQDENVCQVWSSDDRKIYQIDFSASLKEGNLHLDTTFRVPIDEMVLNCASINDSSFFTVLYQFNSYRRCLLKEGDLQDLEHLKVINDVHIYKDLNSMAAIRRYEKSQNKVVEALLHLNQINLYSLDDETFAKTICVGKSLTDLGRIDNSSKRSWVKYYGDVFTTSEYFAALYFNASRKEFLSGKVQETDIQVYDWDGNPLLNITVPYQIESFFIHRNKDLYVLSTKGEEERLFKYDLGDLLAKQ